MMSYQRDLRSLLVREGIAGILRDSAKPDALHNMATTDYLAKPYPLPAIALPHEKIRPVLAPSREGETGRARSHGRE